MIDCAIPSVIAATTTTELSWNVLVAADFCLWRLSLDPDDDPEPDDDEDDDFFFFKGDGAGAESSHSDANRSRLVCKVTFCLLKVTSQRGMLRSSIAPSMARQALVPHSCIFCSF